MLDYHGGMADIRSRTLRIIGVPEERYREDPVRMLRVVRFAAKLGFDDRPVGAGADSRDGAADQQRAGRPRLRRDAEAADERPGPGLPANGCAAKACTMACCRCWTW